MGATLCHIAWVFQLSMEVQQGEADHKGTNWILLEAKVVVCFGENLFIPRSEGRFNIQLGAATPHLCISCLV